MKKKRTSRIDFVQRAGKYLVGGVNSPVRSFQDVGLPQLVFRSGMGARIYDYAGREYTDYCLGWGALIYGHAHRNVVLAVKRTAERGIHFGFTSRPEIDLAEDIVDSFPGMDRIRFVNSGTEAAMSAIRLARAYTGRDLVIKFDGCYHGHADDLLVKAGSGAAYAAAPTGRKSLPESPARTISLPYNDTEAFKKAMAAHGANVAAVIVEPVAGNMGTVPGGKDFLLLLRELTRRQGSVLIFDEVITGFRFLKGGIQQELGIVPDLTCLGKIIGGGLPVGAFGGNKDLLSRLSPEGAAYQAGTFSGNPVVMRAGLATLKLLSADFYKTLNARAEDFFRSANGCLEKLAVPLRFSFYKSMGSLRFSTGDIKNDRDASAACDPARFSRLFRCLLKKGILIPPSEKETLFISGMHRTSDLAAFGAALKNYPDIMNKD